MKTKYRRFAYLTLSMFVFEFLNSIPALAVTPVYVSIFTHNERNPYSKRYYVKQRANLITFGNVILKHGASWSFGSDYTFLDAWKTYETKTLQTTTDGKDILTYLHSLNPKMSLETHAHAGVVVNYADVAYQIANVASQTGFDTGSSPRIQSGIGVDHEDEYMNAKYGTYGAKNSTYFWKPEALFGASIGGHPGACEEQMTFYSGIWHPRSYGDSFGIKSTTNSLLNIGSGYPGTADLKRSDEPFNGLPANYIKALVRKISSGALPAGQFYTAVISAHEGRLYADPSGYTTALDRQLTQLDSLVAAGKVVYVTPSQMIDYWKAAGSPAATVPITEFDEFNSWAESHCN